VCEECFQRSVVFISLIQGWLCNLGLKCQFEIVRLLNIIRREPFLAWNSITRFYCRMHDEVQLGFLEVLFYPDKQMLLMKFIQDGVSHWPLTKTDFLLGEVISWFPCSYLKYFFSRILRTCFHTSLILRVVNTLEQFSEVKFMYCEIEHIIIYTKWTIKK